MAFTGCYYSWQLCRIRTDAELRSIPCKPSRTWTEQSSASDSSRPPGLASAGKPRRRLVAAILRTTMSLADKLPKIPWLETALYLVTGIFQTLLIQWIYYQGGAGRLFVGRYWIRAMVANGRANRRGNFVSFLCRVCGIRVRVLYCDEQRPTFK